MKYLVQKGQGAKTIFDDGFVAVEFAGLLTRAEGEGVVRVTLQPSHTYDLNEEGEVINAIAAE